MAKLKILHVDDSAVIRGIIRRYLDGDDDIEILYSAADGQEGFDLYKTHQPDLVIMDIEMPVMDGMTALQKIMDHDKNAKVIMCSTLTVDNADVTIKAMKIGAIDYIPKPTSAAEASTSETFKDHLLRLVKNFKIDVIKRNLLSTTSGTDGEKAKPTFSTRDIPPLTWKADIVAISSSTGGPQALFEVVKGLKDITKPIVITQHMPKTFTTLLAKHITDHTEKNCIEAQEGTVIADNTVILAQGGYHMNFQSQEDGTVAVVLDDGAPENFCKPAADSMLRSLLPIYKGKILSVVLTGMGHDGRDGTKLVIDDGGYCVSQDEETSVVWGMPGAVAEEGYSSAVLPLNDIAPWVKKYV